MSSPLDGNGQVIYSALREFGQILSYYRERGETGEDDCVSGLHLGREIDVIENGSLGESPQAEQEGWEWPSLCSKVSPRGQAWGTSKH